MMAFRCDVLTLMDDSVVLVRGLKRLLHVSATKLIRKAPESYKASTCLDGLPTVFRCCPGTNDHTKNPQWACIAPLLFLCLALVVYGFLPHCFVVCHGCRSSRSVPGISETLNALIIIHRVLYLHWVTFWPGKWLDEPERAGFLSTIREAF